MRTLLVVGNWKMHGTIGDAQALASGIRDGLKRPRGVELVVCPPFTALPAVAAVLTASPIALGAQNCHWEPSGAFTGEISPPMLVDLGCRWVLLGHSERRALLGETDEQINRKVHASFAAGLTPILCVGESADERRQGLTFTTVEGQLRAGLKGVAAEQLARAVLAYEPVWAIGTGVNATPAQAGEVHGYLRGLLSELASKEIAERVRILYGGSVKPDNADVLAAQPEIDGTLVGGASLTAASFVAIVRKTAQASAPARSE